MLKSKLALVATLMISTFSYGQTVITANTTVNSGSYDPNGYIVQNGTLELVGGTFMFNPNAEIRVGTNGYLSIPGSVSLLGASSPAWEGIVVDAVATPSAGGNKVVFSPSANIVVAGANFGIHCLPTQSSGAPGVAADIYVFCGGNGWMYNFANEETDIWIENTTYQPNGSIIGSEQIDHFFLRGSNGIVLDYTDVTEAIHTLNFQENNEGLRMYESRSTLERSKFEGNDLSISDLMIDTPGGSRIIRNTFVGFGLGFLLDNSNDMVIDNNGLTSEGIGIRSLSANLIRIYNNQFRSLDEAMHHVGLENSSISWNSITQGNNGIISSVSRNVSVDNNDVNNILGKGYYGEGDLSIVFVSNEFLDCSTTENSVTFRYSNDISIWTNLFRFTSQEVTNTYHSALFIESTDNAKIFRNIFGKYKYNFLRITGSASYATKTCINTFGTGNTSSTQEAIKIETPMIDQGTPLIGSSNSMNLNYAAGNQTVVSTTPITFYHSNISPATAAIYNANSSANVTHVGGVPNSNCVIQAYPTMIFNYKEANPEELSEMEVADLAIYPNPVLDVFTIEGSYNSIKPIIVTNLLGQKVESTLVGDNRIDISSLNSGCYIVHIPMTNGQIKTQKIIKN